MAAPRLAQQSRPFQMSLRIRHPSMDPAEISGSLGLEPEHAFKAGQPRTSRSSPTVASVHAESYWLGALDPLSWLAALSPAGDSPLGRVGVPFAEGRLRELDAGSLGLALNLFAMGFARTHGKLLRQIQSEGGHVTLLVEITLGVRGFTITPEVSRMLDKAGIAIEFEFADS